MGRPFILHYDESCIHCSICKTQVGFISDHLSTTMCHESYIFHSVFNVEVPEDKRYQKVEIDGRTVADTYCIKCGNLIGLKVIAIDRPRIFIREGLFFIDFNKVGITNQDGSINEQAAAIVQDGDADEQGGANEQNDQQGGGTNEQNDEQEEDANEYVDLLAEGIANFDLNPNI